MENWRRNYKSRKKDSCVRYFIRTEGSGWHPNIDSAFRRLVFIIAYVCSQLCFRAMDAECMWNEPDTPYTFSLYMSMNGAHVIPWNHFVLRRIYSQSQYWGITCIGRTNDNEGCWYKLTIAYMHSVLYIGLWIHCGGCVCVCVCVWDVLLFRVLCLFVVRGEE